MKGLVNFRSELRGAIEATLHGLINVVSPLLLFLVLLGPQAQGAGLWATLVTGIVVPAVALLLRGHPALLSSARIASLAVYIGLVVQLCQAMGFSASGAGGFALSALVPGLAAASLMYLLASALVAAAGLLKFGHVFKLIPTPVTAGISNGIAMVLVTLALQQLNLGGWAPALTACAVLAGYFAWPLLQRRMVWLGDVPAIAFAALIGVGLTWLLVPAGMVRPVDLHFDGTWLGPRLWPSLAAYDVWRLIGIGLPGAVTLAFVMILETFTTAAAMENRFGLRVDSNRELIVLGGSNMVGAVLGGVPNTGSIIRSLAGWLQGGRGVMAAVLGIILTSALLLLLGNWLLILPAGLVAGFFLVQAGLSANQPFFRRLASMLRTGQWRGEGAQNLGFWIALVIALATYFGGLVWGCFLGVGLSCLAVLKRVSGNLTAQWAYLDVYRSRRVRSYGESAALDRLARRGAVLRLTGHLFFGNSTRVNELAAELDSQAIAVVVDVSQTHDVDQSGVDAAVWLVHTLVERRLKVFLTGVSQTRSELLREPLQTLPGVVPCADLDRGLERCEDLVLMNATVLAETLQSHALAGNALLQDLSDDEVTEVLMLGEYRDVAKGEALFRKDEPADGIWLLESGVVSILAGSAGDTIRLATFGPGQFLGEMGVIDGKTRSATAYADVPVRALLLGTAAIEVLEQRQPAAALTMTRNIARELSHRVRYASALWADESGEGASVWSNSALSSHSQF